MKHLSIPLAVVGIIVFVFLPVPGRAEDGCFDCHNSWEEGEDAPSIRWAYDIHNDAGLTCADCHGGDPGLDDMDDVRASRGYRGVPTAAAVSGFCGRCHSEAEYMKRFNPALPVDQEAKYRTSRHGQLLSRGDVKVATCVSCHSVHNIGTAKNPNATIYPMKLPMVCAGCHADPDYMAGYAIPTDQYDKYATSVHGVALLENEDIGAPACNDCHGNHGAVPPGVEDISAVCGLCHAKVAGLFAESPHKPAFEENDLPQCETCHSNHDIVKPLDEMVGKGPNSLCIGCHSEGDDNAGYQTAAEVSQLLDSLVRMEESATEVIEKAEQRGMAVDDERFALRDVHSALVGARTLVHSFSLEKIKPELEKGINLAVVTRSAGVTLIDEYYFRRKGLGIATIIITLVVVLIWIKIRQIEAKKPRRQ